jgi:hypothetical protein
MIRILAIDPGSEQSGWVIMDTADGQLVEFGKTDNEQLLARLPHHLTSAARVVNRVVIEWAAPRGMPASTELFETLYWVGRFTQAADPVPVERLKRLEIKKHLCGKTNAKDSNIRAALIDRYGGIGGKRVAIGLKASPGPLYGVSKDAWAALAVACTWADQHGDPRPYVTRELQPLRAGGGR